MIGEFALVAVFLVITLVVLCDMRRKTRLKKAEKKGGNHKKSSAILFFPS